MEFKRIEMVQYPNALEYKLPEVLPSNQGLGERVGDARFYLTRGDVEKLLIKDKETRRFPIATNVHTQLQFLENVGDYLLRNKLVMTCMQWHVGGILSRSVYSLEGILYRSL